MNNRNQGALFRSRGLKAYQTASNEVALYPPGLPRTVGEGQETAPHALAYAGIFVFTLLLYVRPQEMFPGFFGEFPLVKIVAIGTLIAYFFTSVAAGERLTVWPIELKMVLGIAFLGILFTPIAVSKQDSLDTLLDPFLKVVIIFVLMINVLNTKERLRAVFNLSVICGTVLAVSAIIDYASGNFYVRGKQSTGRITGLVATGLYGNPNDLATSLVILLPLAVALASINRGHRRILYFVCGVFLTVGVVVTFSRGGFLALVAATIVLLWKLSRRNRGLTILAFLVATSVFLVAMPAGYSNRLTTILSIDEDPTGSAQARRELLKRAVQVAASRPIIGIGMGNFHIYSIKEQVAHNSYLEIAAELGIAGLFAFLILIASPLRFLRRIERQTINKPAGTQIRERDGPDPQVYYFSVALQASLIAFAVCSFFGSIQYHHYIYYLVAYAVALKYMLRSEPRGFEPADGEINSKPGSAVEQARTAGRKVGVLWHPAR